jgi:KUP system potassium uptake protein
VTLTAPAVRRTGIGVLSLGSLGVVFGDIGTSPLYAFSQIFAGDHPIPVTEGRVMGALSVVFWTLTLVVSVKYVAIVMRADNEGEGGIMALASLARSSVSRHRTAAVAIMAFGVLGAALFYGDGMITPAISVLSAVEGLEVVSPDLASYVVPISLVLLIGLFLMQRVGTGRVGSIFGPVMLLWFVVLGIFGLISVVQTPQVLASINPVYAVSFFVGEPFLAFLALGAVVLCVTGAEALYADMGQFGRLPVRLSWFLIASPALYVNYLGQGALVLRDPTSADNPFYLMVPGPLRIPMVVLATLATIIASQAVISGAFSMTQQAMRLGYLPRMTIVHTSSSQRGQVYVPFVNWSLMVAVIGLVIGFGSSDNLASAYGIAVTGTFVITTCLITVVALHRWRLSPWIVWPVFAIFIVIDTAFFASNLVKFEHGGWFPLVVAAVIFSTLAIWRWGSRALGAKLRDLEQPMAEIARVVDAQVEARSSQCAVYITGASGIPFAMLQRLEMFGTADGTAVILRLNTLEVPRARADDRITAVAVTGHVIDVTMTYGFMERPDPAAIVQALSENYRSIVPERCVYVFYTPHVESAGGGAFHRAAVDLYGFMYRNATDPQRYYGLPPERVLELGRLVRI